MIGYVTLGTNNLQKAAAFYDKILTPLEIGRTMEHDGVFIAWGKSMEEPGISVTLPFNKEAATVGNGTMVALTAPDQKTVDKVYELVMAEGGTCEGKPGIRHEYSDKFYVAYFRDLDGNKLNIFHMS